MTKNRHDTTNIKVETPFGNMYIHIHYDEKNRACGGWISDPGKEPNSTIAKLVEDLGTGLNKALKERYEEE